MTADQHSMWEHEEHYYASLEPQRDTQMGGSRSNHCEVSGARSCREGGRPELSVRVLRDEERLNQTEEQKLGREMAFLLEFSM